MEESGEGYAQAVVADLCDRATVRQCDSATVRQYNSRQYSSTAVQQHTSTAPSTLAGSSKEKREGCKG